MGAAFGQVISKSPYNSIPISILQQGHGGFYLNLRNENEYNYSNLFLRKHCRRIRLSFLTAFSWKSKLRLYNKELFHLILKPGIPQKRWECYCQRCPSFSCFIVTKQQFKQSDTYKTICSYVWNYVAVPSVPLRGIIQVF